MENNKGKNKSEESKESVKTCFIITPLDDPGSPIRRLADGVINACIRPILEDMGFQVDLPHESVTPGSITKDIIGKIVNDDLVIANLTGLNPNVMYELGIRHSVRKATVHICKVGTELPFDIAPERTLFYRDDMCGVVEMRPDLENYIKQALEEKTPNNPVYDAIEIKNLLKTMEAKDSKDEESGVILRVMKNLLERMNSIERRFSERYDTDSQGRDYDYFEIPIPNGIKDNKFSLKELLRTVKQHMISKRIPFNIIEHRINMKTQTISIMYDTDSDENKYRITRELTRMFREINF